MHYAKLLGICQLKILKYLRVIMRFSELMVFFDYKMTNIARALGVSRETVRTWKHNDKIPQEKQYKIEVLTQGKLKAEVEKPHKDEL
jgi:uncharacterized protein YjcR